MKISELKEIVQEQQVAYGVQMAMTIVLPKLVDLAIACKAYLEDESQSLKEIADIISALEALTNDNRDA